jgi:hypothetical protein
VWLTVLALLLACSSCSFTCPVKRQRAWHCSGRAAWQSDYTCVHHGMICRLYSQPIGPCAFVRLHELLAVMQGDCIAYR